MPGIGAGRRVQLLGRGECFLQRGGLFAGALSQRLAAGVKLVGGFGDLAAHGRHFTGEFHKTRLTPRTIQYTPPPAREA
jgi:hypothetical protein